MAVSTASCVRSVLVASIASLPFVAVLGCGADVSAEETGERGGAEGPRTTKEPADQGERESESVGEPESNIIPAECGGNLLAGDLGINGNWIGGQVTSDLDDPCGVQGPIYAYGDAEDASAAGLPASCAIPTDSAATIACSDGRCCISGNTTQDPSYAAWGCGIGIGLRHTASEERLPYAEPGVVGFVYTVEGALTDGQYVRVHLKQPGSAEKSCGPFQGGDDWNGSPITPSVLAAGPFRSSLRFQDVRCSTEAMETCGCTPPGPAPLDIQFQVTGGNVTGPFQFCVTELAAWQVDDAPTTERDAR